MTMVKDKLISVIVPVYNVECYIKNCIDSILTQTYPFIEIILVDDGSVDSSGKICDEYANNYETVRVIHKSNAGLASARNAGMNIANGEYIGFVDSDDIIDNHMYEILLNTLILEDADIAICKKTSDVKKMGDGKEEYEILNRDMALKELVLGLKFGSHACDKLFKRTIVGNDIFFPEGKTYEDLFTIYKWIEKSNRIIFLDRNLYYYRLNPNGITKQPFRVSDMNLIEGNINLGNEFKRKYSALVCYHKMALAESAVALLHKMCDSDSWNQEYAIKLIILIRANIICFLRSPYKMLGKIFAVVMIINSGVARALYSCLKGEKIDDT